MTRCPSSLSSAAPLAWRSTGSAARRGRTVGQTAFAAYSLQAEPPGHRSSTFPSRLEALEVERPAGSAEVASTPVGSGVEEQRARPPRCQSDSQSCSATESALGSAFRGRRSGLSLAG